MRAQATLSAASQYAYLGCLVLMFSIGSAACGEKPAGAPSASVQSGGQPRAPASLPPGEAYLPVPDGRIWYKVSGAGSGTPVILLHGGPGYSSFYLKPFEALGDDRPWCATTSSAAASPIGSPTPPSSPSPTSFASSTPCGRISATQRSTSSATHGAPSSPWNTTALTREHVASLTLASAALDIPAWERNARRLVGTLSDSAQRAIRTRERQGRFDAPDYQAALEEFYGKYVWRHPVKADLDSLMSTVNEGDLQLHAGAERVHDHRHAQAV